MQEHYPEAHFFGPLPPGGFPACFAIVTAYNPGRVLTMEENRAADVRLQSRLRELELASFPVEGGALDASHREPGWGIPMDSPDQGIALGCEFGQDAVFWVEKGVVWLLSCLDEVPPVREAQWADRWRDSPGEFL
jgi:hypothetical protein